MFPERLRGEEPAPEIQDYAEQLRSMAAEEGLPEGVLSERGLHLTAILLEQVHHNHGDPDRDSYKHYHNDSHALNVIKRSWKLWKPFAEALPARFDSTGFELLMIAGAGHDIINDPSAARDNPGQNEWKSAELVYDMMLEAGYEEPAARRVEAAITKTTVKRNEEGVIIQTQMRQGPKDIMGLVLGQADMNGILIEGPSAMLQDAYALYLEFTDTPLKKAIRNPVGVANFLREEKKYLNSRVAALSEDLRYYIDDETERELIIAVYRQEFGNASRQALDVAENLQDTPEKTRKIVDASFSAAGRVAQRGLSQIMAVKRYLVEEVTPSQKDRHQD